VLAAGKMAALPAGAEKALAAIPVGDGGSSAMAMLQPGAEQGINPLIQLIMKMPGLTGVMDSFFEFLGMLFKGNFLDSLTAALLDPTGLMLHLFQEGGDVLNMSVDMMKNQMPMLSFKNGMFMPGDYSGMNLHSDLLGAKDAANVGAPIQDVNMQDAIFEKTSNYTISQNSLLDWKGADTQIAMGPGDGVYRPHFGQYTASPTTSATTSTTSTNLHQAVHSGGGSHHAPAHHHAPKHFRAHDVATHSRTEIAQAPRGDAVQGGEYTVQSGDSLWDIARHNLGDGSRWGEIYRMNSDVIGQNPDLIHPGQTLRMPDANSVASAAEGSKYIVQPGDNLWNIAKHHMGGGQNWGELYRMNEGVIGANPRMIFPGQELTLDGSAGAVAANPAASTVATSTAQAPSTVAHGGGAQMADTVAVQQAKAHMGAMKAETPVVAPVEGNTFANSAGVGGETTINSSTQVPTTSDGGMYTAQDGSLFYRNKPQ
jgi:LysM repeat protein